MRKLFAATLMITSVGLMLEMPASRVYACAPFVQASVFWWRQLPDVDLAPYAHGNLGIVSPRYARSYLIVAYRVLSGRTIDDDEALSMQRDWERHLNRSWGGSESSVERWQKARKRVPGLAAPPEINSYRSSGDYWYAQNVLDDALNTASETLRDRERRFGARSSLVRTWVRAQDLVFAASPATNVEALPMSSGAPDIARADRAYQVASAAFYDADYADARTRFLAIAGDPKSPWRRYGMYLAARSALRDGNLEEAQRLFNAVIADPSSATLHASARGLLLRVRKAVEPDDRFRPWLASAVMAPRPGAVFGDLVRHLVLAIDRYSAPNPAPSPDAANTDAPDLFPDEDPASGRDYDFEVNPSWRFSTTTSLRAEDDLLDWIVTLQSTDSAAATHAMNRWRQSRRPVWLVAAISGLRSLKAVGATDVLSAAAALRPESPAYATVTFHRARLLINGGRSDEARLLLDGVLAGNKLPLSSTNRFHDLRLRTARNIDDLVPDLDVQTAGLHAEGYPSFRFSPLGKGCGDGDMMVQCDELRTIVRRPQILPRAAAFIDGLPLGLVTKLASDTRVPDSSRSEIAQAGWVRAFVLGDDDALRTLAVELSKHYESVDESLSSGLLRVGTLPTPAERRFEAAWIVVRYPVMGPFVRSGLRRLGTPAIIDNYGDNWWSQPRLTEGKRGDYEEGLLLRPAPFLDVDSRRLAEGEHRRLRAAGSAGAYMARAIVEGAEARLDDPRVPEALARAVRATRLVGGGEWSRKAYALLHKRFPNNAWAKRTHFWY